jgi:hypothetical protein
MLEAQVRSSNFPGLSYDADIPRAADLLASADAAARGAQIAKSLGELMPEIDSFLIVQGDDDANYYTQCVLSEL